MTTYVALIRRHVEDRTWNEGAWVTWCKGCGQRPWPCDTREALNGFETERELHLAAVEQPDGREIERLRRIETAARTLFDRMWVGGNGSDFDRQAWTARHEMAAALAASDTE